MRGVFLLVFPALAFGFDQSPWDSILKAHVRDGRVDYRELKARPQALGNYVDSLASLKEPEYEALSREDQIAFWINAYNALTLKVILDHYPIRPSFPASLRFPKNSIRQIPGVWDSWSSQSWAAKRPWPGSSTQSCARSSRSRASTWA